MEESFKQLFEKCYCRVLTLIVQNFYLVWVCLIFVGFCVSLVIFLCINFFLVVYQGQRKVDF